MEKVGIITFNGVMSYGACMQSYAMLMIVRKLGYNSEIIDYSINAYKDEKKNGNLFYLKNKIIRFSRSPFTYINLYHLVLLQKFYERKYLKDLRIRNSKFDEFKKLYQATNGIYYRNHSDLIISELGYSAYICGSDQIWNPNFCEMDSNYFLDFAPQGKRISYAPSIGVSAIPKHKVSRFTELIKGINHLSIREQQGADVIYNLTGIEAKVVLDPTLLIPKEDWEILASDFEGEYILVYFIGDDKYSREYLKQAKKVYNKYKIIELVFNYTKFGPKDFIGLIRNAKFIITNSYHGTCFSIIFNKPFVVMKTTKDLKHSSGFSRMESLLKNLKLDKRILGFSNDFSLDLLELDYEIPNILINKLKEDSIKYLENSLRIVMDGDINAL